MKGKRPWVILFVLAILTPLGIWMPGLFGAGGAWGEWGAKEIEEMVGFVPDGLGRLERFWRAPFEDYGMGGIGETAGYVLSAVLGAGLVAIAAYLIGRAVARGGQGKR